MREFNALTDQQRAVVEHGSGPAAVLAVPGAGKTTALVHRIRHLVDERGAAPNRILACSFSRATVADLTAALHAVGVRGVDVRTLHSLGRAVRARALPEPDDSAPDPTDAAYRLARRALRARAEERSLDPDDLSVSARDLVDRIAAWKQRLAYPDLENADLPPEGRSVAEALTIEDADLRALYDHFEARRRRNGWLTYPDLVRDGWEALVRDETVRAEVQAAYDHVLVDEFQDVSRAQFHILDHLTAASRNYMVVGDDDQCIYRWRGARPAFLLDFADRYDATEYRMTASFRLPAPPLVLANAAIAHNDTRRPKRIALTRPIDEGRAAIVSGADAVDVAHRLVGMIERLHHEEATALSDIGILVRTYGQTPPIEQAMIERDLLYQLRGRAPFYRRRPVQTLLRYLYWAVLERRRRQKGFETPDAARPYTERFRQIVNRPNRYVPRGLVDVVCREAREAGTSVFDALADHRADVRDDTAEAIDVLRSLLDDLVDRLDDVPANTLDALVDALDYEAVLRERSARPDRAEARVRTVRSLIRYARDFETAPALLRGVRSLAAAHERLDAAAEAVDLRSIHRAKGAEWPVVMVPGCTEGTLPLALDACSDEELEEERRLFYVAVTRAQDRLVLGVPEEGPRSRFLDEAEAEHHLSRLRQVRNGLTSPPETLSDLEVAQLCRGISHLDLGGSVSDWGAPDPARADALRSRLERLRPVLTEARGRVEEYQQARADYEESLSARRSAVQDAVEGLRSTLGTAPFAVDHQPGGERYPADARFTFDWTDDETAVRVDWEEQGVGRLDPFGAGRLDADTVLSVPWPDLVARPAGVSRGGRTLRLQIDWEATADRMLRHEREALSPPDPPDDRTHLLASEAVAAGWDTLREALSEASTTEASE